VLTLAICYRGVAFPVLFTMLPKAGNSSSAERIELMERFKALFGEDSKVINLFCISMRYKGLTNYFCPHCQKNNL
ncbi:MAG: hypothetical protein SNH73_07335, partial [Rikenellaceae bacterium]